MVKPFGDVPRWHGHVSGDGEAVVVPRACARWRGRQGEASSVDELAQGGGRRAALDHGQSWPYRHGDGESSKLELGSVCSMARWGWAVGELAGRAIEKQNSLEITSRCLTCWRSSNGGSRVKGRERETRRGRWLSSASPWRDTVSMIVEAHAQALWTSMCIHEWAWPMRPQCHKWQGDSEFGHVHAASNWASGGV